MTPAGRAERVEAKGNAKREDERYGTSTKLETREWAGEVDGGAGTEG
jgi:hypothetical protein